MAITNADYEPVKISGTGSLLEFSFPYAIYSTSDLIVSWIDKTTGAETVKALGTDYTVSIDVDTQYATVTFESASTPASTVWVFMKSDIPETQPTSFPVDDKLFEPNIEKMGDRQVRLLQQLKFIVDKCFRLADDVTGVSATLPDPSALQYLRWNAGATALENATPTVTETDYPGAFTYGAKADLPVAPTAGDIYVALDTEEFFVCWSSGTWTDVIAKGTAVTQVTHGFAVGDVLTHDGSTYTKAQADSLANAQGIGVVVSSADANNFVIQSGGYSDTQSGLTGGTLYYLSPSSAGAMTATRPTTAGQYIKPVFYAISATSGFVLDQQAIAIASPPKVVQTVYVVDNADRSIANTTAIPADNTTPQITEGNEYSALTRTITPTSATNLIHYRAMLQGSFPMGNGSGLVACVFKDADAGAVATGYIHGPTTNLGGSGGGGGGPLVIDFWAVAGATSEISYTIRVGGTGNSEFNNNKGSAYYNETMNSSVVIEEIAV